MMYSVWNQADGQYDYWQCKRPQATVNVEAPRHIASRTLGSTVDQAAWPLPGDAVRVGSGKAPVGRIAAHNGGGAGLAGWMDGNTRWGILAVGAVLAYTLLRRTA